MSPVGSWSQAAALLADVNCPGPQEAVVSNWEPAHSLVENAVSGAEIAPRLPALVLPTCLSASSMGRGRPALLRYSFSPLFCEQARLRVRAFHRKIQFFFSFWWFHSLGYYLMLAPSDCPQGSGLVLILSMQPVPPCPAPTHLWRTWASVLLLHWLLWLGAYSVGFFFFFPFQLCCLLRFQNSPHTHLWDGFLLCQNFSFTTPSQDRSPSLTLLPLFLSFLFCPTSFRRECVAFLGAWCPPPVFRSCFVEVAQHLNDLLMNLSGRKWSPCPIPPSWDRPYTAFLKIHFWLCWVLVAAHGLCLVAASGGYSSLRFMGFSLLGLLLLNSTGSRARISSCGSWALLLCSTWNLLV